MEKVHHYSIKRLRKCSEDSKFIYLINKLFSRHGLIVEKYGAALREMRLAIQAWIAPSYPYITYLLHSVVFQLYLGTCARTILFWAHALFVYLFNWRVHLVRLLTSLFYFALFSSLIHYPWLCPHGGWLPLKCSSAIGIGFNGAKTNCWIARILGILLMNSCDT